MLYGILIAGLIAFILGIPVLPILIVGAVLQGLLAYGMTRNRHIVVNLVGLGMVLISTYLLIPIITESTPELASVAETFSLVTPWLVGTASLLLIAHATFVGVFFNPDLAASKES